MEDITLQKLLEAGCHFGHKAERWNPKAKQFIYTQKDGIHIIDLVKTKNGLDKAMAFIAEIVASGGEVLFVGTKRQAKQIVMDEAKKAGAPYMSERWIGGFLTNWEGIHKNIQKIIRMSEEELTGVWKKFPKHEQIKLSRYLARLKVFYGGVLTLSRPPQAVFIIDIKKEISAVREATRMGIPIIAVVDTNSDPTLVAHPIPSNDDAIGAISILTGAIAGSYQQAKEAYTRDNAPKADTTKKPKKDVSDADDQSEKKVSATDEAVQTEKPVEDDKKTQRKEVEKSKEKVKKPRVTKQPKKEKEPVKKA